ncbi:Glutaredoxin-1 [Lodderomyces elongisporus]|uniref:Glutaredoxin-1 n=1 Tax=Lodderomyces elongisporus (strain ATCC 11503 / CBS 2605 / JCM 1781 / NBRC 1676 / NRRL YB-4239) TaxID=379508 RepID=A5E7C5_LODEL|nr:Glutaredoxin-1 [Lodderomyces elongisporus]EDK47333.1 glutaredoxin-1 [Lodderomyces elongisporus NRRL YB-4239]WLF81257.1 Glutaredoxin-1 [Lodderomyces elongisporus]
MFEWITSWFQPTPVSPEIKQLIETTTQTNNIVVYSKTYCPYCTATKNLLSQYGVPYELIELNSVNNGAEIQRALQEVTGQRTVPNIFINGKHIGGNSDLQALEQSNKLKQLLASSLN